MAAVWNDQRKSNTIKIVEKILLNQPCNNSNANNTGTVSFLPGVTIFPEVIADVCCFD
jgi:hypothetical protein